MRRLSSALATVRTIPGPRAAEGIAGAERIPVSKVASPTGVPEDGMIAGAREDGTSGGMTATLPRRPRRF
ncbi:MAG: hypothetical protein WC076_07065 [Terrimicrobiaceae bacterium]|nr:hypothetical protein [Terrimicrobiaceae bacterium]